MVWPCPKMVRPKNPQASIAMETSGQEKSREAKGHLAEEYSKRMTEKGLDRADVEAQAGDRDAWRKFVADLWAT